MTVSHSVSSRLSTFWIIQPKKSLLCEEMRLALLSVMPLMVAFKAMF